MSKRMNFSVVGLPHYTIWHLYEPSVDDIRHMEEMERERKAKEAEEAAKQERLKKINEQFDNPGSQWEKDKSVIQAILDEKEEKPKVEDAQKQTSQQKAELRKPVEDKEGQKNE